ncbi:MAG TPA: cation:proton antiporter [Acidimicrobiales bacterium]|nr:cation:proton antiporter [Acidimicrobiales bacterium]
MEILLSFALTLVVALLVSGVLHRGILSTAVLFLGAGMVLGPLGVGTLHIYPGSEGTRVYIEVAFFAVLFSDGLQVRAEDLARHWRLPARALGVGLPIGVAVTAVLAHAVSRFSWAESVLIAAALAPVDAAFMQAVVGDTAVPERLRRLLGFEAGLVDGLVLPLILVILSVLGVHGASPWGIARGLVLAVLVGVGVPGAVVLVRRLRFLEIAVEYRPLFAFSVGLLVLAVAAAVHANVFLAGYVAGVALASLSEDMTADHLQFGGHLAELLKLSALMVIGILVTTTETDGMGARGWAFVVLAILAVRPVSMGLALVGSDLRRPERRAAAWLGPRGFASVAYALLIVELAEFHDANRAFVTIVAVVSGSILLHSSTDTLVARALVRRERRERRERRDRQDRRERLDA